MGLLQKLFPNVIHEKLARALGTSFESTRELERKKRKRKEKKRRKEEGEREKEKEASSKVNYGTRRKG